MRKTLKLLSTVLMGLGLFMFYPSQNASAQITSEGACSSGRCWSVNMNNVSPKTEYLLNGKAFYFDGGSENHWEGTLHVGGVYSKIEANFYNASGQVVLTKSKSSSVTSSYNWDLSPLGSGYYKVSFSVIYGDSDTFATGKMYY